MHEYDCSQCTSTGKGSFFFWDNNMIQDKVEMSLLAVKLLKLPEDMVRVKAYTT